MIYLILITIALELIQISCAESKIKKWILPILSFLFSLQAIISLILFETRYNEMSTETIIEFSGGFILLNIPTIMFIITNIITKKIANKKEKQNNL